MKDKKTCLNCGLLRWSFYSDYNICRDCLKVFREFRLKIHGAVYRSLKYNMNTYVWKFLPYTKDQLKIHLESQFESWMSWENQGKYIKKNWDENDQSTWTWQIDHIIPQAAFLFNSFYDDYFKKCWSLENLRPISSKENAFKNKKVSYEA